MHRCLSSRIKSSFRVKYKSGKKQASGRREAPKATTRPSATQTINSVDGLGTNKIFILFGLTTGADQNIWHFKQQKISKITNLIKAQLWTKKQQ